MIFLVTVACFVVSAFAELVIIPKDVESIVGGTAQFNCSTTDPSKEIQWFHHKPGSPGKDIVYGFDEVRGAYDGRFSVKKNMVTGEYNLEIIAIRAQDVGAYECQDLVGNGNKSQAQLIVLYSKPKCQSDVSGAKVLGPNMCGIEPDVFQLSCTATFQGSIAPILQWIRTGDGTPITQGVTLTPSANRVTYNLTLSGDQVVNGSSYICQTTKSSSGNQYNCVSDVIRILSPQSNFSIVEQKSGASVRCPTVVENSCSYKWIRTDESSEAVVSTDQLVKLGSPGLYRCEASCTIKTKPCTVNAMLVHVADETSTPVPHGGGQSTCLIFLPVLCVFVVITIVLFVAFFICFKKKPLAKITSDEVDESIRDGDCYTSLYITNDTYETIGDGATDLDLNVSFRNRRVPLPTSGNSGFTLKDAIVPTDECETYTYEVPPMDARI